jgi:two-component system chemotaxis sensor kinase CheA
MTDSLRQELLASFAEESAELFDRIMLKLSELDQGQADPEQALRSVRQQLHTLKGAASAVNNRLVKTGCHLLEESLDQWLSADQELVDPEGWIHLLADGIPILEDWVSQPDLAEAEGLLAMIEEAWEDSALTPNESVSEIMQQLQAAGSEKADTESVNTEEQQLQKPSNGDQPTSSPKDKTGTSSVRVSVRRLRELDTQFAELHLTTLRHEQSAQQLKSLRDRMQRMEMQWRKARQTLLASDGAQAESVDMALQPIDKQLKELNREVYQLAGEANALSSRFDVHTASLRESIQGIRMMPMRPYLESFQRIVFDASRTLGKEVQLHIDEHNVEADRTVLDKLRDPLIHLVKNAVAHGIESPGEREQAGKDPQGEITLDAQVRGETLTLQIFDDGNGIDRQTLLRKARENGWEGKGELTDEEVLDLLCTPGLSTSRETTEISGRGMGLDIVRERVRELHGVLSLTSIDGQGTQFTLQVPTQISTLLGISVRVDNYHFGIPQDSVQRLLRLKADQIRTVNGKEVITWNEKTIAVLPLAQFVGVAHSKSTRNAKGLRHILLLSYGDQYLAVEVDEIVTESPFYLRPLGKQFETIAHLAGGALMPDGSVLPVLEVAALFERLRKGQSIAVATQTERGNGSAESFSEPSTSQRNARRILVVDDSITMRTLEQNILTNNGFDVITAKHGREAQSLLKEYSNIGLVISDVEMPHVNGLQLCQSIREGDNPDLPVILVTSLGSEQEQQAGMQAGADAYIVKGDFRQEHFLETVRRYMV